ncbi:MAG: MFS transporter [Cytophagaceae bacterium]|nr:MAG: MFS transporter [Cytophagaceae bacterium]
MFLKPRLPISSATNRRAFNFSFLKNKTYIMLQLGNVLEGFGYFVPSIYLPSIARGLGASSSVSALTLILLNIATVPGCVCMGWIVDRWHITICLLVTTVGATLSTFLLWGFTTNLALLLVFSFIYGFFAGCFTTTYPGMMKAVTKNQPSYDPIMVYASASDQSRPRRLTAPVRLPISRIFRTAVSPAAILRACRATAFSG